MNTYHVEIREVTVTTIAVQADSLEEVYGMSSYEITNENIVAAPDSYFEVVSAEEA